MQHSITAQVISAYQAVNVTAAKTKMLNYSTAVENRIGRSAVSQTVVLNKTHVIGHIKCNGDATQTNVIL